MSNKQKKFKKFMRLLELRSPLEGLNVDGYEYFGTYKVSTPQGRKPIIDLAGISIVGQGVKLVHAGNKTYEFRAGHALVMFYPMSVETEIVGASPEEPFLTAGLLLDRVRMADVLLRLDRIEGTPVKPSSSEPSGIYSTPLNDDLLDPFIRLLKTMDNHRDVAILGDSIVDEIYYRLLTNEHGGQLRNLMQQRGEIQRISKAVEYIHQNLDQPISVEELAQMVHMGQTTFYENFRNVMHMSPLQYAKSVKLHRAQALIQEGMKANEAGYLVGYNSPAQFSREYKRRFGYSPSATVAA